MFDREMNLGRKLRLAVTLSLTLLFCLLSTAYAAAQATLSATTLNFGSVVLNTVSTPPQTVTLTNNQTIPVQNLSYSLPVLTLYAIAPASTTCVKGSTLGVGASCNIGLTFNPKSGSIPPTSTLTITSTGNAAQKVTLSGTVVSQVTLSTTSINFGNVALNQKSALSTVTVTNNQAVTGLYVTDASSGLFTNIFTLDPRRFGAAVGFNF